MTHHHQSLQGVKQRQIAQSQTDKTGRSHSIRAEDSVLIEFVVQRKHRVAEPFGSTAFVHVSASLSVSLPTHLYYLKIHMQGLLIPAVTTRKDLNLIWRGHAFLYILVVFSGRKLREVLLHTCCKTNYFLVKKDKLSV